MANILLACAVFAFCLWGVLEFAFYKAKKARLEQLFAAVTIFVLLATAVACLLAVLGIYTLRLVLLILAVVALSGKVVLRVWFKLPLVSFAWLQGALVRLREIRIVHMLVVVVVAGVCLVYMIYPTKYMLSGRDYGVYILHAHNIAENGSVQYPNDEYVQEHYEEIEAFTRLGYPGFYSSYNMLLSDSPGQYHPQFLPLFPAALALGYSLLGMQGLMLVNAVVSLLSLATLFFLTRRFLGYPAAILAATFLALCPAQLWGARITQSEQLAQLLFLLSAYCFAIGWKNQKESWFTACAALIGIGCFNRIDNYTSIIAMFAVVCYAALWQWPRMKELCRPALLQTILGAIALWYTYMFHRGYFEGHWVKGGNDTLMLLVYLTVAAGVASLVVIALARRLQKPVARLDPLPFFTRRLGAGLLCGAMAAGLLLCYYVRPVLDDSWDGRNLVEFSWYITFAAMLLAVLGIYYLLRAKKEVLPLLFLLLSGIGTLCIYIYRPAITADHFWASRRWVPVNFPFILMFAAWAIVCLWRAVAPDVKRAKALTAVKRVAAGGLAVYIAAFMLWQCRIFLFHPLLTTIEESYESLVEQLPDDTLIVTGMSNTAGMLKHFYGKEVLWSFAYNENTDKERVQAAHSGYSAYLENNGELYFIGFPTQYWDLGNFEMVYHQEFSETFVMRTWEGYPDSYMQEHYNFSLYRITPGEQKSIDLLSVLHRPSSAGFDGQSLYMPGRGVVFYGPYVTLSPGKYRFELEFEIQAAEFASSFYVSADNGGTILHSVELRESGTVEIEFFVEQTCTNAEFVLVNSTDAPATVARAVLYVE